VGIADCSEPYDTRVQHAGFRVEGVDGGVDTELSNTTGQHGCRVQVSEGRCGSWISQVIGRHIDGLHRGDGPLLCSGDTLLPVKKLRAVSKRDDG
jgi:hypothetical protein